MRTTMKCVIGIALAILSAIASCTQITVYYPICTRTNIDLETGEITVDTLPEPDSLCLAEFDP